MARRRTCDKPLPEPMTTQFNDAYMRHYEEKHVNSRNTIQCNYVTVTLGERYDISHQWQPNCLFYSLFKPTANKTPKLRIACSLQEPPSQGQWYEKRFHVMTSSWDITKSILTNKVRTLANSFHDEVIKWKHFSRYRTFVGWIHRSPMDSPHKGQWRGALMLSLICTWTNGWANNRYAGDFGRHRAHYDSLWLYQYLCLEPLFETMNIYIEIKRNLVQNLK